MTDNIQLLLDESAIRNLIAKLAHLADDGDLNDYIKHFSDDARWGGGGQPMRVGHDDIIAGATERRASGVVGPGSTARHVVSTTYIELDGDTALGRSVFHFYIGIDAQPTLAAMGVYSDTFIKQQGQWRLKERLIVGQAKDLKAEK